MSKSTQRCSFPGSVKYCSSSSSRGIGCFGSFTVRSFFKKCHVWSMAFPSIPKQRSRVASCGQISMGEMEAPPQSPTYVCQDDHVILRKVDVGLEGVHSGVDGGSEGCHGIFGIFRLVAPVRDGLGQGPAEGIFARVRKRG